MTVGIYGLGRFGSFWAEILSRIAEVKGYSRSPERTAPNGVTRVFSLKELAVCDVIVLCNSISSTPSVLRELSSLLTPGTLVMDTCSVKMFPVQQMLKILPDNIHVLGTHPMFGPDSASKGLGGLPLVLCHGRSSEDLYLEWKDLFQSLGFSIQEMTPEEHDREAAYTQGITHFVGRMLNELPLNPSPMATAGYKALLEIIRQTCNDSWQLFVDIQKYNPYTDLMRKDLHAGLNKMLVELDSIEIRE